MVTYYTYYKNIQRVQSLYEYFRSNVYNLHLFYETIGFEKVNIHV